MVRGTLRTDNTVKEMPCSMYSFDSRLNCGT
jgi:hypothetical protein